MGQPTRLDLIRPLLGELVEASGPGERDGVLLGAALRLGMARAAGIWKRVRCADESTWRPVVERGPAELLPAPELVRASLAGALDEALPGGGVVLRAPGAALVLGGVDAGRDELDLMETLLHVWHGVAQADGDSGELSGPLTPTPSR